MVEIGPAYRRVADDLRQAILDGVYAPGAEFPSESALMAQYGLSRTTIRNALQILRGEGRIDVPGSGRPTTVRALLPQIRRDGNTRYQYEKDMVIWGGLPSDSHLAREVGLSADQTDVKLIDTGTFPADHDLSEAFRVRPGHPIRRYTFVLSAVGVPGRIAHHYYPAEIDAAVMATQLPGAPEQGRAVWPGGTMFQLARLGIEVAKVEDTVTARMPLPDEASVLRLREGVPLLCVRKVSIDTKGATMEVVDVVMPADRAACTYAVDLRLWFGGAQGDELSDSE